MSETLTVAAGVRSAWPGWCCSYCGAPLAADRGGLACAAEDRWFATQDGIHRLLPEERRRAHLPFVELYRRVRRDEGWRGEPSLPFVPPGHPHVAIWRARARRFAASLDLARERLGPGPWRILDVGAGCGWASARLVEAGHAVVAVDVDLDEEDGLGAAGRLVSAPQRLWRAEAEMDALPLEPSSIDLALVGAALHHAERPERALLELHRVTRRGGVLLVLDSPVYRRRADGEAMVQARTRLHAQRYGVDPEALPRSAFLVMRELPGTFANAGWKLEMHGWPGPVREGLRDVIEIARWGRRTARFPILLGRRA